MGESFEILLNGMPLAEFWVWYVVAIAGSFTYLLTRVYRAIRLNPNTPNTFSWRYTARGAIKLVIAIIITPIVIIYFSDISPLLLDFLTKDITLPDGYSLSMEINGFSAFLTGLGIDYVVHKVLDVTKAISKIK